jgi:hypothetical protein
VAPSVIELSFMLLLLALPEEFEEARLSIMLLAGAVLFPPDPVLVVDEFLRKGASGRRLPPGLTAHIRYNLP